MAKGRVRVGAWTLAVSVLIEALFLSAIWPVSGATLLDVSGNIPGNNLAAGFGSEELAASWTFSSTFTNVSISAYVYCCPTAYLTTRIGPGASAGDIVAGPVPTVGSGFGRVTIFSGLTLGPNTYYLVLGDPGQGGWLFIAPTPSNVTTAPGVTHNIDSTAQAPHVNPIEPYVSTFSPWNAGNPFVYSITGDAVSAGDATPPNTTVNSGPSSSTTETTATFTFSGTDDTTTPGSLTFECSLDGIDFQTCSSGVTY